MPKIKFTQDIKIPTDMAESWAGYVKDSVHDMSLDNAERWLRRGVAEVVSEVKEVVNEVVEEKKVEPEPKVELPEENKVEEVAAVSEEEGAIVAPIPSIRSPRVR